MIYRKTGIFMKGLIAVCAAAALFAVTSPLMATGIGVYGGAGIGRQTWENKSGIEWNAAGGLVVDTAVAMDKLFNYRFSIGCGQDNGFRTIEKPVPYTYRLMSLSGGTITYNFMQTSSMYYKSKVPVRALSINMSHAFGFGVLRTSVVRLWLGPELFMAGVFKPELDFKKFWEGRGGLGLILGVNANLGDLVTLSVTGSARAEYGYRFSTYQQYKIEYMTVVPTPPFSIPSVPISKKKKSLKDKGFRFGGELTFAVLFRVGDTFGVSTPGGDGASKQK